MNKRYVYQVECKCMVILYLRVVVTKLFYLYAYRQITISNQAKFYRAI